MPFSAQQRNQARGAHAAVVPQVAASAPEAGASGAVARVHHPAGALRPSQVPPGGAAAGPDRTSWAGGQAVQRAVQVRPSGAGAQSLAAPPSAIPAQPVRDVLRGPGQPLAGPVREEMEARLGADLSDVRIHDDDAGHRAARAVGARAFTAGSHIAFRRSQYDPASAAGRLTLAHELTHVLQQRSGPVAGTDAGDGIRVSDPADSFERAAQASAQRALAGGTRSPAHPARAVRQPGQPVTPTGDAVPVQRAVGFEFELTKGTSTVYELMTGGGKSLKTDSKAALAYLNEEGELVDDTDELSYISADNGNVEYVTEPLETRAQVYSAVERIVNFHTSPATSRGSRTVERTGLDGKEYRITIPSGGGARVQASIGVGLENIPALFRKLRALAAEKQRELGSKEQVEEGTSRRRSQRRAVSQDALLQDALSKRVGLEASAQTQEAERLTRLVLDKMKKRKPPYISNEEVAKATGFLAIIFKTALDADARKRGRPLPDAKYAFTLMPRTDFISMFLSMRWPTRSWIEGTLVDAIMRTRDLGNTWLDENVFGQYVGEINRPGEDKSVYQGPTRRAWLQSIITGTSGQKDAISPPEGNEPHSTRARPEGIGAMGIDPWGLSVFEFRGFMSGKETDSLPPDSWIDLALIVASLAAEVTGDADLAEP